MFLCCLFIKDLFETDKSVAILKNKQREVFGLKVTPAQIKNLALDFDLFIFSNLLLKQRAENHDNFIKRTF